MVTAAALVLAACSSSGHGSSAGTGSGGPGTATSSSAGSVAPQASGSTWVIGTIGSYTGPEQSALGPTKETMQAWAAWENANGGVDGHQIKLIAMDDHADPATSTADVQQLVQQDHIIAIVGENSIENEDWASYVQKQGVPVIGASNYALPYVQNPDFFPDGTTALSLQYGLLAEAKAQGDTKFGTFYCAESPSCAETVGQLKSEAAKAGEDMIYTSKVSATAPNYTAQCLGAKAAGVNALVIGTDPTTLLRVADDCYRQGYKPQLIGNSGTVTNTWLKDPATYGMVSVQPDFPSVDRSVPADQTFAAALTKYAPDVINGDSFGQNESETWAAGMLFAAAAKAGHLGANPTPADVVKGLYALKGETLGGLVPPLTYKHGPHQVNCWFVQGLENGKFTVPQGLKVSCEPGLPTSS